MHLPAARVKAAATINQAKKVRYISWQSQQESMQHIFQETEDTWQRDRTYRKSSPHHIYMTRQQMLRILASIRAA